MDGIGFFSERNVEIRRKWRNSVENSSKWFQIRRNSTEFIAKATNYSISLSIAKNTHQLPSYTKTKGLDKEKLRQMILQYLSNAGDEGAKRDSIYEYLKDVLPANKTEEQKLRMLGDLLKNMSKECLIKAEGRT